MSPILDDDDLRAVLHRWADEIIPSPGDPTDAMVRTRSPLAAAPNGPTRAVRWAAAAAAVALLGTGVALGRTTSGTDVASTPGSPTDTGLPQPPGSLAAPVLPTPPPLPLLSSTTRLVFRPSSPEWTMVGLYLGRDTTMAGLRHTDGRRIALQLGAAGTGPPDWLSTWAVPPDRPAVRGHAVQAGCDDPAPCLWWEEADHSWLMQNVGNAFGAAAEGFVPTGRAELLEAAGAFSLENQASFEAWLPPEALALLRDNPDAKAVDWQADGRSQVLT